jgi:hypothetical protein
MAAMRIRAPWQILVKHWKKGEYLSGGEIYIWQLLNDLLLLPVTFVIVAVLYPNWSGAWAFYMWLAIVIPTLLLPLSPRFRARQVRLYNRKVDKKKSKTQSGA